MHVDPAFADGLPTDSAACPGDSVSFEVEVAGVPAPALQWRRDGKPIDPHANPSATTPTLVLTNVEPGDAGAYDCVATGPCAAAVSSRAMLTVGGPSCCPADFNDDGVVNSTDVSDFVNAWFEDLVNGTRVTDWDANGVVNSTDVSSYINAWFLDSTACG